MRLHQISLSSLWRRKSRFLFLMVGLVIAVSTVVMLTRLSEMMSGDIASKLDEFGANILIVPASDDLSFSYGGMNISGISFDVRELQESDIEQIRTIKNKDNIKIIAPKLLNVAELKSAHVLVAGVDFKSELALKKWWKIQGQRPASGQDALAGWEAARKLNLVPGQSVDIKGQTFRVTGVLEATGSQDDALLMIDLRRSQQIFDKAGKISLIEVAALCYDCPIEDIVAQTSQKLPGARVTAIQQTIRSRMASLDQFKRFGLAISLLILVVAGLIAFTSVSASVNERKKEIGIMRAIGYRQVHVMQIILLEILLISILAGLAGYFGGSALSVYAAKFMDLTAATFEFNRALLGGALLVSAAVGILAGFIPSVRAARMDPVAAIRSL